MTIENYGPNGQGPRGQYAYSSTAFWYQAELTPAVRRLRGVKYTGGDDPAGKPGPMEYNPARFLGPQRRQSPNLRPGHYLRAAGRGAPGRRGEGGQGQDRHRRPAGPTSLTGSGPSISGWFRRVRSWAEVEPRRQTPTGSTYLYALHGPGSRYRGLSLRAAESRCPSWRSQDQRAQLGGLFLTKGEHPMRLVAAVVRATRSSIACSCSPRRDSPGRSKPRNSPSLEPPAGRPSPRPSDPIAGVSAGRVLEFRRRQAGQGFVLDLGKRPALPYVLGVRPMLGPKAAILQRVRCRETDRSSIRSLRREATNSDRQFCPSGRSPLVRTDGGDSGRRQERPVAGIRRRSRTTSVGSPNILGPGTANGIWAQVVGTHDCDYRPQDLGPAYSGGHQFWVQPSSLNAWVDIAIRDPTSRPL